MKHRVALAGLFLVSAACHKESPPAASAHDPSGGTPSASASAGADAAAKPPAGPDVLTATPIPLPGVTGAASLDYIAYEPTHQRVWVPVGTTGSVDVLDTKTQTFTRVDGFKTGERDLHGTKRVVGPSSAAAGAGFVYVGNRASSEVCPVDIETLKPGKCLKLPTAPDGLVYVASVKELWVNTPEEQSITVLDVSVPSRLAVKTVIKTDGDPEGYAIDEGLGLFFTNLEDKGGTVVVDVRTHKVKATWNAGCGPDGPRGIAFAAERNVAFVACTDHIQVLDGAHDGAPTSKLDAGAGVDNIDYAFGKLYVAAGKSAKLTVASVDKKGALKVVATGDTAAGARNAVADEKGNVYVADSAGGRLLVFAAPKEKEKEGKEGGEKEGK